MKIFIPFQKCILYSMTIKTSIPVCVWIYASSACPRQKMGIGKVDKDMALFYEDKKEKEKEEK